MVKLKPFMDYMTCAWQRMSGIARLSSRRLRQWVYGRTFHAALLHQPKRKCSVKKNSCFETQPGYQLQHDWGEVEVEVAGQRCKVNFAINSLGFSRRFHVFAAPKQDAEHTYESLVRAFRYFVVV
ncbi:Transposase and inactivated derivatives [Klebsiella pneumoniae]|uniref:Transposase and inactivated derivatives n=1 Tax=Klebsiella pneumoniae TaxID=573 RepID=A0A377XE86_KLEPN|nr:Transposase and inactivated derivatives [Klebsiella pneumoniae]